MLEGAVARILNQLLGKYVVDLDTENLNVGIFSGHVQLTDLKLKTEALYELNLPIQVEAGTIGKIWLQIPWSTLWSQPVVVNIEDVHIIAGPIVTYADFDQDKNKRLLRAFKRKALSDLSTETDLIGGPSMFSEYLVTNIINNLQLNISNVHVRYEDHVSGPEPIVAGFCIGSITAETTNSKWKACRNAKANETCYYLIKMEAFCVYCNPHHQTVVWDLPSQYYAWRNSMSSSLQNYSMNGEEFDFLVRPMTSKIKMTINKNKSGKISKLLSDIVVHDFNVQISKGQYEALLNVYNSLSRMFISWDFLAIRPKRKVLEDKKAWWKYAYEALVQQRIKPYTWSKIRVVRENYRLYTDIYKQILLNPNDTELKLDLQMYEDRLSIVNIVIARQQARLAVHSSSLSEKSFWDILPSPERQTLCERIGFQEREKMFIEYTYNFRIGNANVTLMNEGKEILVLTMTQFISSYQPNFADDTYKFNFKIEGIIVEGASIEEHLVPIVSSDHNGQNSPAYFLRVEIERLPNKSKVDHKLNCVLEYLEVSYHKYSFDEIRKFLGSHYFSAGNILGLARMYPQKLYNLLRERLLKNWDIVLDIKLPYLVVPEKGSLQSGENILIIDFGHMKLTTELCQNTDIPENATLMELEEQMYSRFHMDCTGTQVLFCDNSETWRDSRREKDTELHIVPKTNIAATYSACVKPVRTLAKHKLNVTMPTVKLNSSERTIVTFLKFMNSFEDEDLPDVPAKDEASVWKSDKVVGRLKSDYLLDIQRKIILLDTFIKNKRNKDRNGAFIMDGKKKSNEFGQKENMNEAWARCVDLPGLEDNISPNNTISVILRFVVNEFQLVFSRSSDSTDRQYLMLRLGLFATDIAWMTYGPAYQISLSSLILTDKLHTTPSGQYLDLIHSPFPTTVDVVTILYRKVAANCPDFWTHFHGVETSLVADFGTLHVMLHQEAFHTIIKYMKYLNQKVRKQISPSITKQIRHVFEVARKIFASKVHETPVPPGSVKFSHSARLGDLNVRICDSDFDIINLHLSGLEVDFLFRANERFVFRSFLSNIIVEHLSDITLYTKILRTDEDKVFEVKYVRYSTNINKITDISPTNDDSMNTNGSFKLNIGRLHFTFLYKLVVQLHRFVVNLEAIPYFQHLYTMANKLVNRATESLKTSTKIHLAINVKGPILLIPQKSSSPNIIILDLGTFNVENFYKDYRNETVENILVRWYEIIVSRGIMTLTSSVEMQEIILEPVSIHLDIKHYITLAKAPTKSLSWDIDGIMDTMRITLGQKDLCTILSIYTDNIGEGKLIDLLPESIKSPIVNNECDETVKTLEAFFCEPKQKDIFVKFSFDSINLLLFFDSGELLSSPIRDLNHGLFDFEISDIATSFIVYTDRSLDGKLSVDKISIEEIGPDANAYYKGILQSPTDDNKNNNCNITVNKPPIIDITFHQNKTNDKSIDAIVGRLAVSLSVPFCEKLAMFVIECFPKETMEIGIVNQGYVSDQQVEVVETKPSPSSLTISLRVNKPEFVFWVETASNKKRYFITKTEILSDYSRHANRQNFVLSLSGLHTLFYDVNLNAVEPYTILKQCDVEFCKSFTEEKGEKITTSISSIYVQFCNRVVYSINDILNDIVEHFKVPEVEISPKEARKLEAVKSVEAEELWEPKKLSEYVSKSNENYPSLTKVPVHEIFLLPKTEVVVILELEEIPVFLFKSTVELTVYDWSSLLNMTCELTIQANYFNDGLQTWEPLIDPVVIDENVYKPWEVFVKVFQDKAQPILSNETKVKKEKTKKGNVSQSTTEDEDESGDDMIYLEPTNVFHNRHNRRVKTSLSTFLDDSDSENEDCSMEKLATAISDLFTGDWNESEGSECEQSSEGEEDSDENVKSKTQDLSTTEPSNNYKKATYILIDAKDTLNLTITPSLLKVFHDVFTMYTNKTLSIVSNAKSINIINDIGPQSKVELFENRGNGDDENAVLIVSKTYEKEDSCPNSPTKSGYFSADFVDDVIDDKDSTGDEFENEMELGYDFDTVNSLEFPQSTTAQLYEKINKHQLKVFVPGFQPLQTSCPKKATTKLMRMHSTNSNQIYYLITKTSINKHGRTVIISSPLQIRNETCFALSILYQPSVLQQLNLEPVGDVTNPFETTMRIAVLEPHEHYNVPLYIAYHCKLFIQPAYAEGHYASNRGIWWRDLVTDLDIAHNFHCDPKSSSNLEVFSLRVMLRKNINVKNSHAHSIPNYIIHLLPPLILHNYLPYSVTVENVEVKQYMKVEPGEKTSVYSLNLSTDQKLVIKVSYHSATWSGTLTLTPHLDEKVVVLCSDAKSEGSWGKHLAINVKAERDDSCNIFFYTPYWIVNKTSLPLHIKASSANTTYGSNNEDIVLFTYKRHGKQTLQLKVYDSDWSNEFGLDCAGTTGLVVCKDGERRKRYSFLLTIRLSEMCPRLTKIVTLLPSFLTINNTSRKLRFMEHNEKTDLWIDIAPGQYLPFWPETSSMQMYVKFRDSKVSSQAFYISNHHHTVLRMDKGGAICVNVSGGKTEPFKITFNDYKEGDAPIYIKNMCSDLFLKIQQQGQSPVTLLSPYNAVMYTWDDPTKPRQLIWNVYNNKGPGFYMDILKDSYGEEKISFHSVTPGNNTTATANSSSEDSDSSDSVKTTLNKKVRRDKIVIYWIVFREGEQRTLIFIQDQRIYSNILQNTFMETCDVECLLSVTGVGLSFFTPAGDKKEHLYCSFSDVPATWEVNVGHKWKTLTLELASWIEDKYRLHYKKCQLKDYVHIDFEKMFMLKPFFAELRRSYSPAIYGQLRKSENYKHLSLKVQSFQVDNKQVNSNESVVLCPLPVESIKSSNPFVEFTCLKSSSSECDIYKHVNLSIRDFYVNMQNDLIVQLTRLFVEHTKAIETTVLYRNDMCKVHAPIHTIIKDKRNSILENLYLSQTLIQLNILNKSHITCGSVGYPIANLLSHFFPYNISPYMPIEGVRHKITPLEMVDIRYSLLEGLCEFWEHFSTQFLQQYYAQVLGLQVLVNPYALQSIPGIERMPNEAEKMCNLILFGCRCLLGHMNMSSVALEQCIIEIFANQNIENIQRIRRHGSYHNPSNIPKAITSSCKNFNPGVILALNQVIAKSQNASLQCDGELFFRGTGKALISLVTRHPDEKSDSVQVAIEALKRASLLGEPIKIHQRLTRYTNNYLGLRPFSVYESMGCYLLETLANGRFSKNTYWTHAAIDKQGKSIIIVSLEHVIRANKCRLWGPWELEWSLDLDDIVSVPKVTTALLILNIRQGESELLNTDGKVSITGEKDVLVWLQEKIEQAIVVSMEDKSWTINENN